MPGVTLSGMVRRASARSGLVRRASARSGMVRRASARSGLVWLATGLALGGVALAACSTGSSAPSTTAASTGTTSTTGGSTGTTAATPGGSSTTAAGTARCATTGLTGSVVGSSGAAGTIETTVGLKNTSAGPCVLGGYPGLQLLSAAGSPLPTTVVRKGTYSFTAMPATTVTLPSGSSAYFNIGYSDVPVGDETTCPASASLEITPPNAYDHLIIGATLAPCGGGTMVVSPVFLSTGSNSQTTAPPTS